MVALAYNPSTWVLEAGGLSLVYGYYRLPSKFEATQGCMTRPCPQRQINKQLQKAEGLKVMLRMKCFCKIQNVVGCY